MEFFLAWRYFKPRRNAVSLITLISLTGVALGVAVLIVVLAVMTGFTDLMKEKLLETTSHIQIYDNYHGYIADPDKLKAAVERAGGSAMPVTMRPVLVQRASQFVPKTVIGIDPTRLPSQFNLGKMLRFGELSLEKDEAVVSTRIAGQLALGEGGKMLIHSPARIAKMIDVNRKGAVSVKKNTELYLPHEYRISGLYSFGKHDFDSNIIFLNREDANEMFDLPWTAATCVYVWAPDPFRMDAMVETLKKDLKGMSILTWQEINRDLLGVLQVEKNMMFFLLVFIVLVAAFSITNTLITVVVQKTREIGVLKALGASSFTVLSVFVLQGFFVGLIGTALGTTLGVTVIHYRNTLLHLLRRITNQPIFPPEFYYFNELPAHIVGTDLTLIIVISIVLCTLGAVIPAWRAARLAPAEALRYE